MDPYAAVHPPQQGQTGGSIEPPSTATVIPAAMEEPVPVSSHSSTVKMKKKRKASSRARLSPCSSSPLLVSHPEPIPNSKTSPSDLAGEPVSSSATLKGSRKKDGEHSGRDNVTKDGFAKPLSSISRQMSNTSTSESVQFEIGSMTPANSTLKMNRHTSNIDITLSCPDGSEEQAQAKALEEVPESMRSDLNETESGSFSGLCPAQTRIEDRRKKTFSQKKPWFSAINPNYKSRSQTFKKIFSKIPTNERLIVEYSCALQKDILIQGRIYFTSNYLCFYANIFTWETSVVLRWNEIAGITKEKTALVIPNAIQFNTTTKDKFFFASFTSRDKTFNTAMKIWQNCMLEEFSSTKMWQLIHESYGDELGLTTEDEDDYLCPLEDDEMGMDTSPGGTTGGTGGPSSLSSNVSSKEGFWSRRGIKGINRENSRGSEYNDPSQSSAETGTDPLPTLTNHASSSSPNVPVLEGSKSTSGFSFGRRKKKKSSTLRASEQNGDLGASSRGGGVGGSVPGTDLSCDSDEDGDDDGEVASDDMALCNPSNRKRRERVNRNTQRLFEEWQAAQEGREMTNQVYNMDVDMLFTFLFTNSKFYADFHKSRKTTDLVQSQWEQRPGLNDKFREVSMTLSLNNAMGPKNSGVVDSQVMKNDYTVAGEIYAIHVETVNSGIPYADSFFVTSHFCLTRVSKETSRLVVWSNIKYKKSVWGFVKSIIEKNTWLGLEEFYNELSRDLKIGAAQLAAECEVPSSLGGPLGASPVNLKPTHAIPGLPEAGEPILSQGMPLPYTSIRTLQPNEALRSPKSTAPELQNVSKAAVILLILLLSANCLLYYKVWFLETTLVVDPSHSESNSHRGNGPSSFYKHLDPSLFLDKDPDSQTTEQWLGILQQQEMVHQLELEKWGEMLGAATELLRKTEDSLSNIQKSIQPLTLQKVRQMLLLQPNERFRSTTIAPPIEREPPPPERVDERPQVKKPSEVHQPHPHVKSEL
ncbi:protein Aster-A-like [Tigriopus californicus]|uniref:protein Aster-A-like n=1 Tax=Tigriopus californicus TaxID=6832 RepID=UPI0027DA5CDC|nr:protein Aster-A-like [Tigriopus californicus]